MRPITNALAIALVVFAGGHSVAGPYADDLSRCLIEETTTEDRNALVRWFFAAASRHPAVSSIAVVADSELEEANRSTGELFMRLLTDSCREAARKALKYEGQSTIQTSFSVLGEVAGKELFTSPDVAQAIAGLQDYVDETKLKALVEGE